MSDVIPVKVSENSGCQTVTWAGMGAGDVGVGASTGLMPTCLQISGTFSSATVAIEGSMDGENWYTLHAQRRVSGSSTELNAVGAGVIHSLLELAKWVRPVVTASGTPSIKVIMVSSRVAGR